MHIRKFIALTVMVSISIYAAISYWVSANRIFGRVLIDVNTELPSTYVDGMLQFIDFPKVKHRIRVIRKDGIVFDIECYGSDSEMFPTAIPCKSRDHFKPLEGKDARVWYLIDEFSPYIGGGERLLAVQMQTTDGHLYPFDTQKRALIFGQENTPLALYALALLLHASGVFLIWFALVSPAFNHLRKA